MRTIAAFVLVGLLGIAAPPPPHGKTSVTYYDTYGVVGPCSPGVLTLMNGYAPAHNLSFPAGQGPPLVVSLCNFSTPQYVQVTLGTPTSGAPFIRQSYYTVTVDAPDSAGVTATWTACGSSSTCATPGLTGTVNYTIGPPDNGGGL
ncbi:MAG: hypothetical protein JO079_12030 [Frankiaceae bacterium]|nr:hypothetical protein [Frankiaceae bacterium]